jgi:hypothetical protein
MRSLSPTAPAADATILRDKALTLHESANSSRERMNAQAQRLERLRGEIAALRAMVGGPLPVPAAAAPAPAPKAAASVPTRRASIMKGIAADSASMAVSFKTNGGAWKRLPYALIFLIAIAMQFHSTAGRASVSPAPQAPLLTAAAPLPAAPASPEVVVEDDGAAEALLLAHDWHLPGDEFPLSERLGSATTPPGSLPEWMVERTGERTYRVSYRPGRADTGYDFDVDLNARTVDPTSETADLIAPRLVSRR